MKEHALFIRLGLPCDQVQLIAEAQAFFDRFVALETQVNQAQELDPTLLDNLIQAVRDFIDYKRRLLP